MVMDGKGKTLAASIQAIITKRFLDLNDKKTKVAPIGGPTALRMQVQGSLDGPAWAGSSLRVWPRMARHGLTAGRAGRHMYNELKT